MRTIYITRPLADFLAEFAGRKNTQGYDESRTYKIADCNRDFVWNLEFQTGLIKSVLTNAPIPTIAICNDEIVDGGNRSTTLHQFVHNQFKVNLDGVEYNYDEIRANADLNSKWLSCQVNLMVTTGATDDQFADLYENLNKGVKLTHGQMMMNRNHYPLVKLALGMINRPDYEFPLRDIMGRVWKSTFNDTKTKREVTFAFQIVASALFGHQHFHTKFPLHTKLFVEVTETDITAKISNLSRILETFDSADPENNISRKTKSEVFQLFIGGIIYDYRAIEQFAAFQTKWKAFIKEAYTDLTPKNLKQIVDVGRQRSKEAGNRIKGISDNVRDYLNRILVLNDQATPASDPDDESV
jgi:hypothetical protein